MTSLSDVMLAVVAALQVDHGAGLDFSDPDAVKRGRYSYPPAGLVPFAAVASPPVESERGPPMGMFTRRLVIDIEAWVAVTDTLGGTRETTGEAVIDALTGALEDAHQTGPTSGALYSCKKFNVRASGVDVGLEDMPLEYARVIFELELEYLRASGV